MKRIFLVLIITLVSAVSFSLANLAWADVIPDIKDSNHPEYVYHIRDNALILLLQPVPDNSGDYTMTLCNKQSRCRQTSMRSDEIRYIGLFLEDTKSMLIPRLNKQFTGEKQWWEERKVFGKMYADYMNMYDSYVGTLKTTGLSKEK